MGQKDRANLFAVLILVRVGKALGIVRVHVQHCTTLDSLLTNWVTKK